MPSLGKIRLFRFIEWIFLFIFVIWTAGLVALWFMYDFSFNEWVAMGGVSVVSFMLFIYLERTVDGWVLAYWSREGYVREDVFSSLYERSPVGYMTLNKSGQIVNANPSAVKLLEGEIDTINQISFKSLIDEDSSEDAAIFIGKIRSDITIKDNEFQIKTLEGLKKWVMVSSYPYHNTGERLVSLVDVTAQKNIDTAKSEFVALATHQLRTPIAAIRWNVELLGKSIGEQKTESQDKYLYKINRNVLRMIDLINDFLSVSKLEMGTYASQEAEINLTGFFSSILDEYSEKITDKKIVVNRQEEPQNLSLKVDERLMHITVSNLVSNAVKYLEYEGQLLLAYGVEGGSVHITIADNGMGIPENELPNLFTKFFRASNAQAKQTQGTGLGLYIVKQSVEQMGGEISVESSENEGTKFTVSLPLS